MDWETLDYRSFYFDFYYTMFMLASKSKGFDKVDKEGVCKLTKILEPSFKLFYDKIQVSSNFNIYYNTMTSLKQSEVYRYLFYLELVNLKLHSARGNQGNGVTTWIKRFELYEKNLRSSSP